MKRSQVVEGFNDATQQTQQESLAGGIKHVF
jgi:hypothetical protein